MPIMDGKEATRRIREHEKSCPSSEPSSTAYRLQPNRIPILAVSASIKPQDRAELIGLGFDGFVLKPIHVCPSLMIEHAADYSLVYQAQ